MAYGSICVKRSPARVCWHLLVNGQFIKAGTKKECKALQDTYVSKYGLVPS